MRFRAVSSALISALILSALVGSGGPSAVGSITTADTFTVPAARTITIAGHGWGHGHGMSQWGAAGAATEGLSYAQILSFYYPGTTAKDIGDPTVKVFLASQYAANAGNIHIADPGTIVLYNEANQKHYSYTSTATWRVVMSAGKFLVQDAETSGWVTRAKLSGPLHIDTAHPTNRVSYPVDRTYSGWLRLVPTSDTHFHTIANVSMQAYLEGVVPAESLSSWPAAALQAQSVAARSYAAYHLVHPHSTDYNVYDTTTDQVFGGQNVRVASTDSAVLKTAGMVRTYAGEAILAQFSSSNGGWATDGGEPYLPAHSDPYDGVVPNSVHSWSATVPASAIEARYPSIGTLRRIEVTDRDGHGDWGGRVQGVTLIGSGGSVDVSGADIYSAYSWPTHAAGLRSSWFQIVPTKADVTGDTRADLVTGAAGSSVGGQAGAGTVALLTGATSGLAAGGQLISQATAGMPGTAEAGDGFGSAVATGDFNGDGHADIAVGVPGEDIGTIQDAGLVDVLPGSASGATTTGATEISLDSVTGTGGSVAASRFGAALATGDVNGDGYADLIVGAPGATVGGFASAGLITVIPGSASGLQTGQAVTWTEDSTGVPGSAEAGDQFGATVAAGDLTGDGKDDVVLGAPGETNGATASGQLRVLLGGSAGLVATPTIVDGVTDGNPGAFGRSIAIGDINHDGRADVVAGGKGPDGSGAITYLPGNSSGLSGAFTTLSQSSAGVPGAGEPEDSFGAALAVGDANGDGYADVLVGNPTEAIGTISQAGDVTLFFGRSTGLSGASSQEFDQDTAGISGASGAGDRMGVSVALLDLTGDRIDELVIGVPGNAAGGSGAGSINLILGSAGKINVGGNRSVYLSDTGARAGAAGDGFGSALSAG